MKLFISYMVHKRKLFYFNKYCHNRKELDPRLNPLLAGARPLLLRGLLTAVVTRTVSRTSFVLPPFMLKLKTDLLCNIVICEL